MSREFSKKGTVPFYGVSPTPFLEATSEGIMDIVTKSEQSPYAKIFAEKGESSVGDFFDLGCIMGVSTHMMIVATHSQNDSVSTSPAVAQIVKRIKAICELHQVPVQVWEPWCECITNPSSNESDVITTNNSHRAAMHVHFVIKK